MQFTAIFTEPISHKLTFKVSENLKFTLYTRITLLRVPYLCHFGLRMGVLDRVIRVGTIIQKNIDPSSPQSHLVSSISIWYNLLYVLNMSIWASLFMYSLSTFLNFSLFLHEINQVQAYQGTCIQIHESDEKIEHCICILWGM